MDWKQELKEAKQMLDDGLLTEDQFNKIRESVIEQKMQSSKPPVNKETASNPFGSSQGTMVQSPENPLGGSPFGGNQSTMVGLTSGMRVGDYDIVEMLGEGGMGSVYRGRHHNKVFAAQGGDVAIKLMKPEYANNPSFKNRFLREAGIGRRLFHKNIAQCLGFVDDGVHLALIMSYVEGEELKDLIPDTGMSLEETLKYVRPIATALDYLHSENIVHRDIKPENIKVNSKELPVILDMGIAKDTSTDEGKSQTKTSTGMGTLPYMAPEQYTDAKNVSGKADQYALGMMVYEMLSGRLPWEKGTSEFNISANKAFDRLQRLEEISSIEHEVSDYVHRSLESDAGKRYGSCVAFIETLSNWKTSAKNENTDQNTDPNTQIAVDSVQEEVQQEEVQQEEIQTVIQEEIQQEEIQQEEIQQEEIQQEVQEEDTEEETQDEELEPLFSENPSSQSAAVPQTLKKKIELNRTLPDLSLSVQASLSLSSKVRDIVTTADCNKIAEQVQQSVNATHQVSVDDVNRVLTHYWGLVFDIALRMADEDITKTYNFNLGSITIPKIGRFYFADHFIHGVNYPKLKFKPSTKLSIDKETDSFVWEQNVLTNAMWVNHISSGSNKKNISVQRRLAYCTHLLTGVSLDKTLLTLHYFWDVWYKALANGKKVRLRNLGVFYTKEHTTKSNVVFTKLHFHPSNAIKALLPRSSAVEKEQQAVHQQNIEIENTDISQDLKGNQNSVRTKIVEPIRPSEEIVFSRQDDLVQTYLSTTLDDKWCFYFACNADTQGKFSKKLAGAQAAYLSTLQSISEADIVLLGDNTMFGSATHGFCLHRYYLFFHDKAHGSGKIDLSVVKSIDLESNSFVFILPSNEILQFSFSQGNQSKRTALRNFLVEWIETYR